MAILITLRSKPLYDTARIDMNQALLVIYLARHGETEWSISGQHTALTHLPLNITGATRRRQLGGGFAE